MDSASEFLRMLQHEKSLTTAHRPIRLRLGHADHLADEVLLPQRVSGSESVCGGLEYVVTCVASTPRLPLKELIALPAEVQLVTDRGQLRGVCGIVAEARAGDYDGGLAVYQLVIRDALAIMEKRINSRVFRYQSELDIVQLLFEEWSQSNGVMASAFDYELDPLFDLRQFPPREQTMQHNESDAAFVRRLLKRRGVAWTFRPGRSGRMRQGRDQEDGLDAERDAVPSHTLVLFANPNSLPRSSAGSVRYHRNDATEERDSIDSWCAARRLQPGSTTRHSWDYRNPIGTQLMTTSARSMADQGRSGNELAASLDDYVVEIPHAGNDVEDHWRLGQVRMNRHEFETKCFHGEGSVRDLRAGEYFTLLDHPEIDTHPAAERDFVVTSLRIEAESNLPADVAARVRRLMGPYLDDGGATFAGQRGNTLASLMAGARVRVSFDAVRRGIPLVPAFDPRADLPHPQLQSAIVTGPPGEEVHCDALGRVKIRFPGMRPQDHRHAHGAGASDTPADSAWVRVASNWAGGGPGSKQQAGTLGLPRVGSEVLVAFLGGDPDRPVILSQLFNGRSRPPALSRLGELPGNRYLSGMRSHEVGGTRGGQLLFDDTPGEIAVQLASEHGASELNLGWLGAPRANGRGAPRGEGAELRSDKAVAVRGGEGVLISAGGKHDDGGGQLERGGLVGIGEVMQGVLEELGKLAAEHGEYEQAKPRLAELVDKLRRWHEGSNVAPATAKGGQPVAAVTAPAGVMLASEDNIALGAQNKIDLVSAGDTEVAAGRSLFLRAARALNLFAYELGLRLIAGRGNIVVQTDKGDIEIKSSGHLRLIAAKGIELEAPAVKVVSQGAQTDWDGGAITHQSSGKHVVKSGGVDYLTGGGGAPVGLKLPETALETDERVVVIDRQTSMPAKGRRYIARHEDGTTIEGVTDDEGRTSILHTYAMGDIELRLLPDDDPDADPNPPAADRA
ncbi:type VI secretion system Vgr family protein [Massilia sp. ST3]|uniref:type VI secretion system Vgr family protein n=1 Tax=Massilia sp. ST3 TaxID=2824903 RepID=UPI001B834D1B|nr:type VI secretion system Vgr family protein [Massilia sp. ST3]MBQ5947727.1 type VI secretion system tip protein VgrG [Massilia sp. ST3]